MPRQLIRIPVVPGEEGRLAAWIRQLDTRREDLAQVLRAEGIEAEVVALERSDDSTELLIYTSGPDLAMSNAAFLRSMHPVDVEFRLMMRECLVLPQARDVEVLLAWP